MSLVNVSKSDGVCVVKINRPDKLNAMNTDDFIIWFSACLAELHEILRCSKKNNNTLILFVKISFV